MIYSRLLSAFLLLFAPLVLGAIQNWAIGVIFIIVLANFMICLLEQSGSFLQYSTPLTKPLAALLALTTCSLLFSVHYYTSSIAMAQLLAYLFFYHIVLQISQDRLGLIFLVYWIIGISTLLCLIGLAQRSGIHPVPWLDDLGKLTPNQHWLNATFWNHNHIAGWLEMSVPILICLILFDCQRNWLFVQTLLLFLQITCLILTFSRGGWGGLTIAVLFIVSWLVTQHQTKRGRIIFFSSLISVIVAMLLLASPLVIQRLHQADLSARILIWQSTIKMILSHWLVGTGPGTYALAFTQFQPIGTIRYMRAHNDYLQFTAELGLLLPFLILWMSIIVYQYGLHKIETTRSRLDKAVTLGALAGITALLVHSAFDFNLHIPANALLFTTLIAFIVRRVHH